MNRKILTFVLMVMINAAASEPLLDVRGTLVVFWPVRDGMVAAADTRTTVAGRVFDVQKKLVWIEKTNVVFTVSGTTAFLPLAPPDADMKRWLVEATPLFDGSNLTELFMLKSESFDKKAVNELSAEYQKTLAAFFAQQPASAKKFLGSEVARVSLAKYFDGSKSNASFSRSIIPMHSGPNQTL